MIQDGPLDALAASLVVPSKSGIYLTKSELIVLARICEGSLRVSDRKRMLADVLKSPDTLEALAGLIDRLLELCQAHLERHAALETIAPSLCGVLEPWKKNAARTIERLVAVRAEIVGTETKAKL